MSKLSSWFLKFSKEYDVFKIGVCFLVIFLPCLFYFYYINIGKTQCINYMKTVLNVPDSFRLIDYRYNSKLSMSRMVYKAKNRLGMELDGKIYFKILKNDVEPLECDSLSQDILDFIESNVKTYDDFRDSVVAYRKFFKGVSSVSDDLIYFHNSLDKLDRSDYYSCYALQSASKDYCYSLHSIKSSWNKLPDFLQSYILKTNKRISNVIELPYYYVHVNGNFVNFSLTLKESDIYPYSR